MTETSHQLRIERRDERRFVAPHRGDIAVRLIATFVGFAVLWAVIVVAGVTGAIPLWLGAILSFVVATTFYMPMHEATHGNVWGDVGRGRWVEDLIGTVSSFLVGISYRGHRISHMKHHAFTNDPAQDPDVFVDGPKGDLVPKFYGYTIVSLLLPLFAFVPATTRLLPRALREREIPRDPDEDRYSFRFWLMRTVALVVAFAVGIGWEVLWLWFVPTLFVVWWLGFIFAWYPHHPAEGTQGRYFDTRVAVFPGSTIITRGHDHHALHHLFPRVVHYRLPKLWQEIGPDMTAKGVRTEGRALGATGPIVW